MLCWVDLRDVLSHLIGKSPSQISKARCVIKLMARKEEHSHLITSYCLESLALEPLVKPSFALELVEVKLAISANFNSLPYIRNRNGVHLVGHLVMQDSEPKFQAGHSAFLDVDDLLVCFHELSGEHAIELDRVVSQHLASDFVSGEDTARDHVSRSVDERRAILDVFV